MLSLLKAFRESSKPAAFGSVTVLQCCSVAEKRKRKKREKKKGKQMFQNKSKKSQVFRRCSKPSATLALSNTAPLL
jgi:hypothetical protein